MARRKILKNIEYAQICLNCPYQECIQDYWGECERTKPYTEENNRRTTRKNKFTSRKKGEEEHE